MSKKTQANSRYVKKRKRKRKKEAWKEHYEVTQIRTRWNAEGMPEKISVKALACWPAQDLSQKQLAGCVLTRQTDHQQLSSRFFILHAFGTLAQSRCLTTCLQTTCLQSRVLVQLPGRRDKGGALNKGLRLIKQLIRVLGSILERHIWQWVEIERCSADVCQAMVALQLWSSF